MTPKMKPKRSISTKEINEILCDFFNACYTFYQKVDGDGDGAGAQIEELFDEFLNVVSRYFSVKARNAPLAPAHKDEAAEGASAMIAKRVAYKGIELLIRGWIDGQGSELNGWPRHLQRLLGFLLKNSLLTLSSSNKIPAEYATSVPKLVYEVLPVIKSYIIRRNEHACLLGKALAGSLTTEEQERIIKIGADIRKDDDDVDPAFSQSRRHSKLQDLVFWLEQKEPRPDEQETNNHCVAIAVRIAAGWCIDTDSAIGPLDYITDTPGANNNNPPFSKALLDILYFSQIDHFRRLHGFFSACPEICHDIALVTHLSTRLANPYRIYMHPDNGVLITAGFKYAYLNQAFFSVTKRYYAGAGAGRIGNGRDVTAFDLDNDDEIDGETGYDFSCLTGNSGDDDNADYNHALLKKLSKFRIFFLKLLEYLSKKGTNATFSRIGILDLIFRLRSTARRIPPQENSNGYKSMQDTLKHCRKTILAIQKATIKKEVRKFTNTSGTDKKILHRHAREAFVYLLFLADWPLRKIADLFDINEKEALSQSEWVRYLPAAGGGIKWKP